MKKVLVVAMALGLSACGSIDFFGDSANDGAPAADASAPVRQEPAQVAVAEPEAVQSAPSASAPISPPPVTQAASSPSAHCTALAKQRATDAAYQGEDGDTQESVYNRTYSDCVAWDLKHNL